jgi:hypothetical protein
VYGLISLGDDARIATAVREAGGDGASHHVIVFDIGFALESSMTRATRGSPFWAKKGRRQQRPFDVLAGARSHARALIR